ncbi:hypothetical protein ACL58G_07875 [Massilia sp. GER05]|uniref:hypothetical protein n=1 Tax=Massilia sp. GER05 TaxID=3394605 RepID=UPI003F8681D9
MAITLNRGYMGLLAGTVVGLTTNIEQNLIAQGLASAAASKANITPGNVTYNGIQGSVAIAAGANSVTITNALIDANTKITANIAQAAADGTLTSLPRIVPAAGSVTIYGNANATAAVIVDWSIVAAPGLTVAN